MRERERGREGSDERERERERGEEKGQMRERERRTHCFSVVTVLPSQSMRLKKRKQHTGMKYFSENKTDQSYVNNITIDQSHVNNITIAYFESIRLVLTLFTPS